jgi:hypothetical protein
MGDVNYLDDDMLTVSSSNELFDISFFSDRTSLRDIENFVRFVKACEWTVRKSDEYKNFKAQVIAKGLDRCQILGHISSDGSDDVDIEMHHGPLFTLFDYCAIVIDALLFRGEKVSTFRVGRLVLDEHFADHIQIVMLSKTVHQLVDTGNMFIHFNQATGNISEFIKAYHEGLTPDRIEKINKYIELCDQFDTFDNGLLDLKNTITDWNYDVALERMKNSKG